MDHASSVSHLGPDDLNSEPAKKRRHWWIWVVILLAFGLLFFWVLHRPATSTDAAGGPGGAGAAGRRRGAGPGGPPVPVTIATAAVGSLGVYQDAIGTVTAQNTVNITSQATGVIAAVHYSEGEFIHKGDPLIDIDPRPYAANLAQAQGVLQRDQSLLAMAQMDLKRYQDAWAKNAIPRQTLEDEEKQVQVYQGTVKNDEGVVQLDQVQLSYCHILAPITGKIGLRLVDPGNLVTANSTTNVLLVVTQVDPITVIFTLPEDSLPSVMEQFRKTKALTVQAYDRTQQNLLATGKLTTIDNQIDTTTGTVKMRATFDNKKGTLYPNQFVNARLLVKTLDNQIMVPSSAIQHNGDLAFVYLLQPNGPGGGQNGGQGQGGDQAQGGGRNGGQGGGQGQGQGAGRNGGQGSDQAQGGGRNGGQGGGQGSGQGQGQGGGQGGGRNGGQGNGPTFKAVMHTVNTGLSDKGNTAVTGLNPGDIVANSSFEKLQDGSTVFRSRANLAAQSADATGNSAP